MHCFTELVQVKRFGIVVVSNLEFSLDTLNTSGTSSSDRLLNLLKNLCFVGVQIKVLLCWGISLSCSSSSCSEDIIISWFSSSLWFGSLIKFPGTDHHLLEVSVIIDRCTNIIIVLIELFLGNNVVWCLVVSHGVSSLEGLKEFLKNLIFGFLSRDNVWVLVGNVNTSDIGDVNPSRIISIKLFEALSNNLLSLCVHWSSDGSNEFIKSNISASVNIEVAEELLDFTLGKTEHVIGHSFGEFIFIKRSGVVIIHNFELSLESNETS